MNKRKQEQEKKNVLSQIKHTSLSGNKMNNFIAYQSEGTEHILMKFAVWLKLREKGYETWCEPIFKSGIRFDVLALRDGIWTGYEILSSETLKELKVKTKSYPSEINIVPIKEWKDIKNLEMY